MSARASKLAAVQRFIPGVFVGDDVEIGSDCVLHPNVVVRHGCRIGDRVILHAGVVIGSDGFGYAGRGESRVKIPQVGIVVVEDDVEIGANTTIDRATLGQTVIRRGAKIDNLGADRSQCDYRGAFGGRRPGGYRRKYQGWQTCDHRRPGRRRQSY